MVYSDIQFALGNTTEKQQTRNYSTELKSEIASKLTNTMAFL